MGPAVELEGRRFAVIGGAGLVGSHVVDALLDRSVKEVVVLDDFTRGTRENLGQAMGRDRLRVVSASMTEPDVLRETLEDVDGVFLLASLWLTECLEDPRRAWSVNVLGTWNVIEACRDLGVQRVVYSSSASVYGNAVTLPMTEEHPFANRTTYGATKIACEQMFRAAYEQYGLAYLALRYMNVYGPRMDRRGVYVGVIVRMLDDILAGRSPVIYGDGTQTYDFIYVADAAEANVLAMLSEAADVPLNVGTGIGTTLNEIADLLLELTGSALRPERRPEVRSIVTSRVGSTDLARRLIGFEAKATLREGLARLLEWRMSQQSPTSDRT
jgi:UDP-glucose 4-epimerase